MQCFVKCKMCRNLNSSEREIGGAKGGGDDNMRDALAYSLDKKCYYIQDEAYFSEIRSVGGGENLLSIKSILLSQNKFSFHFESPSPPPYSRKICFIRFILCMITFLLKWICKCVSLYYGRSWRTGAPSCTNAIGATSLSLSLSVKNLNFNTFCTRTNRQTSL